MEPISPNRLSADLEFRRLQDLMPASARMTTKLLSSQPGQSAILSYQRPWFSNQTRIIRIHLPWWLQFPVPQRDLLLLHAVSWQKQSQWLKPSLYQGIALVGLVIGGIEGLQQDALGVTAAIGLSAIAVSQTWRHSQGVQLDLDADQNALEIAQRRGYSEVEAVHHLLEAIALSAQLEGRDGLSFNELIRVQQLKTVLGVGVVGTSEPMP